MEIKNGERPWGFFRQFTENEPSTVKLINVNSGERLSLQYHLKRNEFWVVLAGSPVVTIGDKVLQAGVGDEFVIPERAVHRIEAKDDDVQVLELAFCDFDEEDIVRIEDIYGRKS